MLPGATGGVNGLRVSASPRRTTRTRSAPPGPTRDWADRVPTGRRRRQDCTRLVPRNGYLLSGTGGAVRRGRPAATRGPAVGRQRRQVVAESEVSVVASRTVLSIGGSPVIYLPS